MTASFPMNSAYLFGFWFGVISGTVLFGIGIFALFDGTVPSVGAFGMSALFFGAAYFYHRLLKKDLK